ncbi:MAG: NF038122 family metalloprotease [Acidobacteria bacterium]|nr:NF038122 family metalloprotease [Acidobacteriota bacterium]
MKGHTRYATLNVRRILLLIVLACLLAGGLAGIIFQSGSAAQDNSLRLNPKNSSITTTVISQDETWQGDLTGAKHPLAALASEQLHAEKEKSGYVIETDGAQSQCRTATREETQTMQQRDPEQQLHAITHEETAGLLHTQTQVQSGNGLKIILRTTPQLEQFPAAKAAFIRAAQHWESLIQTPITVVIDVDYGPTWFGVPYDSPNILGSTDEQYVVGSALYPAVRTSLIARASSTQESALYNQLPQSQIPTDIGATVAMGGASAVFRALGILDPIADPDGERANLGTPPAIGFNSAQPFDFDHSDGIASGKYDFDTTATHEIGHALGFTSEVGEKERVPSLPLRISPQDLFRFRPGATTATFSTTQRILSPGGEQVLFGGGSDIRLSTGRNDHVGGDGQQASHWKDIVLNGGRYIGIMHPRLDVGMHWEISENDLKALDLMGYQVNSNPVPTPTPGPNQQSVELKADDGVADTGVYSDGLMMVTRLTPPSYPATLQKLRFIFAPFQGQPDPTGKPVTLVFFTDPSGSGQPVPGTQLTRITTNVPGANISQFFEIAISNGPTINSGDFYVGFQASTPHQGVGFALDTSGQSSNRTFFSSSNGSSFSLLAPAMQVPSANAMIRAVVGVGGTPPTPTPTPGGDSLPLTSGMPQTFVLAAPPPNGALLGSPQYRIQVPSGATQLKVTLSGNQDVDLYARFGRLIDIQNNAAVADFKSESATGEESITITPGSSPALQAGTYYIAVGNFGPGEATATVTATVIGGPSPTPSPGGNTVALTSGVPQTGSVAASQQPGGGILGEPQYSIQIPSSASQLKVNLSGNQDVDLYVRFGNRIAIQNGALVADFRSESETGNESITITPGSSPALQTGTYYIGVVNWGSGTASFSVTATVSGGPTPTPTPPPTPTPTPVPAGNRVIRIGQAGGSPGGAVSVPVELASQGDENALGFSLTFDPSVLSNPQANLGSDAAGATLNANTNQVGSGRLGIALSLPTGQKFNAGTRQIVIVNFTIAGGASGSSTPVGFGDQPIAREISDVSARSLQASFTAGAVSLASGYEADVAPRPNGNGSVTITDWVQIGRFVAGQDAPSAGEFQRADCAPRDTRGNGSLTITDWVQAGRYAAGLDAPTSAGGPGSQGGGFAPTVALQRAQANAAMGARLVRISSGRFESGQQSSVVIELGAEGNENALGFSLNFDPAQLRFVSASVGKDVNGATLNINTSQAAAGRLGLALALPAGQTLVAGQRQIIVINFSVPAAGGTTTATISFGDQPVARELSDANANSLPVTFTSSTVTLMRSVASVSAASFTGQTLASEAIVAAFGQNLATQLAVAETLPLPTTLAGTTVMVRDSTGQERMAPLFFVAPTQINYQIPADVAPGEATVTITSGDGWVSTGMINIAAVAPGFFSAASSGQGVASAVAFRLKANGAQSYEPVAQWDAAQNRIVALPIDLGAEGDQVYLILFGTGFRHQSDLSAINIKVGDVETAALYAGPQGVYAGLDQLNLRIPRALAGRGEVDVAVAMNGAEANRVKIRIK